MQLLTLIGRVMNANAPAMPNQIISYKHVVDACDP